MAFAGSIPAGKQLRRSPQGALLQYCGLNRDRERVQIGDPVERFMIFLQWHPLAQRT